MAATRSAERRRIVRFLENERNSGALIVVAALVGLALANSPLSPLYEALRSTRIGPTELHLDLTVAEWIADGLLAIFFFVIGGKVDNFGNSIFDSFIN